MAVTGQGAVDQNVEPAVVGQQAVGMAVVMTALAFVVTRPVEVVDLSGD